MIACHGAFEPTNMWPSGCRPSSPTRLPAGANTIPIDGITDGAIEPHRPQNAREPCAEDW